MKRLKIFILLLLSSFCLLTMPINAKALDLGNFAGDEDFSYDSDWQKKDISELRPYMTDAFYAQMQRQLDQLKKDGQTNIIRRPAILGNMLLGWRQDSGNDIIIARLQTRLVNYIRDDATGAIISGSEVKEKFMTYEWTLTRTTGVMTASSTGVTAQTCPHCGAQVNINQTAECPYCGCIITTDTFDWAISNITALSQQTK
ncbi:MAG: TIM44-like domain-containing protein [Ruminococcus sp.]|uniref:TIM44-like domain-containing protein n=1 Tax=Ruminococcus sp. TaxID=41978 RepID=UPI0025D07DE2|nr:TIM44-like domain-containing protein [Ruminococcus sp.]MCR4793923.1 TIM44-like domain-containing protein [Ruminococcus sp.]